MTFANAVKKHQKNRMTTTANGMAAHVNTGDNVLDLFTKIGSYRGKDTTRIFNAALAENEELAMRVLLWSRDIRQGAGERAQFRNNLKYLDKNMPHLAAQVMHKIPELGRWDDLFSYENRENRMAAFAMIREALADGNGLTAKWMPRKGKVAAELTRFLAMTPRSYRKMLVSLTNVVETKMCAKDWDKINFSHVPSMASSRYQKAFGRNATDAYSKYLAELQKPQAERNPKVKINASVMYPHDVIRNLENGDAQAANAQWEALPNYVGDSSVLAIVDTSGSMGSLSSMRQSRYSYFYNSAGTTVKPIEVAVALGLYTASKNRGAFKDLMMIFDTTPRWVEPKGNLLQRVQALPEVVAGTTDLEAAFDMMLSVATKHRVEPKDMPKTLLIMSDMQFNCVRGYNQTAMQMIRSKYNRAGYEVPRVVYWNLSPHGDKNTPVQFDTEGAAMVSGFSPSILTAVLGNELDNYTPYNVMLKTLMSPRYDYK